MHFIIDPYRFGETDPYIAYVTWLMHFDGANGGTTFTEEMGHTMTRAGSPYTSATQYKFGPTSMRCEYDGLGRHGALTHAQTADLSFGSGEYCIEWWQRTDSVVGESCPLDFRASGSPGAAGSLLFLPSGTSMRVYNGANTLRLTAASTLVANVWQNWVLDAYIDPGSPTQRVATLYLDGVSVGSWVDAVNYATTVPISIGRTVNNTRWITGYIDELRSTKGLSRYQGANFTPQTAPWPNS